MPMVFVWAFAGMLIGALLGLAFGYSGYDGMLVGAGAGVAARFLLPSLFG